MNSSNQTPTSCASPLALPLDVSWIHGSEAPKYNTDPDIQAYAYNQDTVILRQNMAVSFEAPFVFLLFGQARALLLDTGATSDAEFFPLRETVDQLIDNWLTENDRTGPYPLVVVHTHPHGDHTAGDEQFTKRADTVVVNARRENAWPHFGFDQEPDKVATVDLGGRVCEAVATPGHHPDAVTFYDPATGILFTGDTVYPGRLYVSDWAAFDTSINRLIDFCSTRQVTHVLGCHIEMSTTPGVDFPVGSSYHPDERPLELTVQHLHRIRNTLDENNLRIDRYVLPDLIIDPIDPTT